MPAKDIAAKLNDLVIYRNLLKDGLVQKIQSVLSGSVKQDLFYELSAGLIIKAEKLGLKGNLWRSYIGYLIARDENVFSSTVEKTRGNIGSGLRRALLHDLTILKELIRTDIVSAANIGLISDFSPTDTGPSQEFTQIAALLSDNNLTADILADKFTGYYVLHGSGKTAGFAAFRWDEENGLTGVRHLDTISLDDIIGYETQKEALTKNTEAFLAGKPANNVLLAGARGTGKSSSVKALINRYSQNGLRLVEVNKHQFRHLNKIIDALRGRGQKFIVFLDDLSFEDTETDFKYLKSLIEGGIEARPDNVLLYATSNRRHLIKETWSDREGTKDIHTADSVHEKISLSDRFGLTLTYPAPDQTEYLNIVEALAEKQGVQLPPEELKKRALRWELSHSGRSGRVAQQFIKHIIGNG